MVFNSCSLYCVNANQLPTSTFYYMHECHDSRHLLLFIDIYVVCVSRVCDYTEQGLTTLFKHCNIRIVMTSF